MFPVPARVLFPALVSVVSALWAAAEWRQHYGAELTEGADPETARLAWEAAERRRVAAEDRAERKLRLAEAREARLTGRSGTGTSD